ncbi:MAG TPA: hypothetical protein VE074_13850 [Jatrophihabitantaceae bacterium]|nr:hypothetical protein [Jatrophihabitantaceae bacterium]
MSPFGDGTVLACAECVATFIKVFSEMPTPGGLVLAEGPVTRIADALLAELGAPPARPVARPFVWRDVPLRVPRRGKLRR